MTKRKKHANNSLFIRIMCFLLAQVFICSIFLTSISAGEFIAQNMELNESNNILSNINGLYKEMRGITYYCRDGAVRISGTPIKSSYINLLGSVNKIPKELKTGDKLHFSFSSGTKYVALGIRAFNAENPDGIWLIKTSEDTDFIVPDLTGYTGVAVRILTVQTERVFDMDVYPKITVASSGENNILSGIEGLYKEVHGITYSCRDGAVRISGTPIKSSYVNLLGSVNKVPKELKKGDKLHFSFSSGTKYIALGIRAFNAENPDGIWLIKTSEDTDFIVPDLTGYTGVAVRILTVQTERVFDMDVYPQITVASSGENNILSGIEGLYKEMHGITYSCRDGEVHISGTPSESSYIDLLGSAREVPKEFSSGDRLQLNFSSETNYVFLGVKAFDKEHPSGEWLIKTTGNTEFIIPDLSGFTGLAIRIHVVKNNNVIDLKLTPEIKKQNITIKECYLTIIDDDGDIHYKTDIIPFIQRVGVPISSAVTPTRIGTYSRWMSWDDILYCNEMGGEILCHMYNHYTGTQMKSVSNETLRSEFELAYKEFQMRGLSSGKFLVYSSSTGNMTRVQEVASNVFSCGIKIGGNVVNHQYSNLFALSRFRIDYAETEGRQDWNYEDMISYVDSISENGGWGIWMIHTSNPIYRQRVVVDARGNIVLDTKGNPIPMVDSNGDPVLDTNGTYPTIGSTVLLPMLEKAISYAQSQGVKLVTVKQGYEAFYNH